MNLRWFEGKGAAPLNRRPVEPYSLSMKLIRHVAQVGRGGGPRVVTLGGFDGVHRGHQRVLERAVERAAHSRGESAVLLLYPDWHVPAGGAPLLLTGLRRRLELLAASRIELVVVQRWTAHLDALGAERFVRDVLVGRLQARWLVVGDRLRFGKGGEATPAALSAHRLAGRLELEVVPSVEVGGQVVSSRGIRAAVAEGDLPTAARMLGRFHSVEGRVVHGHHRGAPFGIPTANLRARACCLPPDGVYAVRVCVGEARVQGVANIGFNPTFGNLERSVETHLLDFERDVYGERLEISFVERLRGEQKFPSVEALVEQIRRDIAAARRVLAATPADTVSRAPE